MEGRAPASPLACWRRRSSALQLHRRAHKRTSVKRKAPWQMRRARNADALVCHNFHRCLCVPGEAMPWVGAQIHFMMTMGNVERLREFARPRAETFYVIQFSPFFHPFNSSLRFQSTNQNETVLLSFHEHIQHPVHPIIKINVGRAGLVSLDKGARARAHEGVTCLIIYRVVSFRLDEHTGAISPDQFRADQLPRANERIAFKKRCGNDPTLHLRHPCEPAALSDLGITPVHSEPGAECCFQPDHHRETRE